MATHDMDRALNETAGSAAGRMRVFVSYSRKDAKFADELVAGLEYDGGFEVFLDRHSIHEGEDWQSRLGGLISAADIVVFLLSKSSAASELCKWEAEHARSLSKRIVPALIESVDGAEVSPVLKALNYVRFDEDRSFMEGLVALRRALRADLGWIREHTRLLNRAQEWESAGRIENRLLTGPDIVTAKQWLEKRPPDAPPPLELHHDFIAASEQAETVRLSGERQRSDMLAAAVRRSRSALAAASGLAVVAVGLGGVAGYQWMQARAANLEYFRYTEDAESAFRDYEAQIADLQATVADLQVKLAAPPPVQIAPPVTDTVAPPEEQSAASPPPATSPVAPDPKLETEIQQRLANIDTARKRIAALAPEREPGLPPNPDRATFATDAAYLDALVALETDLRLYLQKADPGTRKVPVRPRAPEVYEKEQMIRKGTAQITPAD